ncbi:MAG: hypothetical protein H8E36_03930 [Rhodospirillaceae bacterium]|nr:hypothetical protein [Rhodospirillaceae bacterium]MBL6930042.1 hypothetical protein [Rhodospirillales bacterium]MBL6941961.1 hypothetical protein [Rhodospirillales bacterium]
MPGIILILSLLLLAPADHAVAATSTKMDVEGNWFSCEFAHSQIPPNDGCLMLDDDGFMVSNGQIDHVKVIDSREQGCRHQRLGQCFERNRDKVVVSRDNLGPIRATAEGFAITYWGCTQDYRMVPRAGYFEITPTSSKCLWTRDKRYFVYRYRGKLEVNK